MGGAAVAIGDVFGLSGAGEAGIGAWKLGAFTLSRMVADAGSYCRSAEQVRRDLLDHWVVGVATHGPHGLRSSRGNVTVPAGVPVVFSLAETFDGRRAGGEWICLLVPRDSLPESSAALDRCCHRPLASAPGRLLGGFLQALAAELPRMREAEIPRAVEATRAMLAAATAAGAAAGPVDDAEVQAARLARVQAVIRQHLRSPDLSPEWLCRVTGMSRSQLYRLFEPAGGAGREIQRERLRQAHRAIADPDDRRTIHEIGGDLGFAEPTTFSRAFRRQFGYPPSALRRAPAQLPPAAGCAASPDGDASLGAPSAA
jgi:AraC-like DNA-binding protein